MNEFFNKHYVRVNADGNIITGFSDTFQQPEPADILINDQGGYQFRLFPGGEENPPLLTHDGIPLYCWNKNTVQLRTDAEIQADRDAIQAPASMHTQEERISALESAIAEAAAEILSRRENR